MFSTDEDGIIHLVTAANGAEKFYQLGVSSVFVAMHGGVVSLRLLLAAENNQTRTESIDQAREVDEKIKKAWMGHHRFVVVDNSGKDFATKMSLVMGHVLHCLGEPLKSNQNFIKRKFIVKEIPKPFPVPHEVCLFVCLLVCLFRGLLTPAHMLMPMCRSSTLITTT